MTRRLDEARFRHDRFERRLSWGIAVAAVLVVAFWAAVIYVALHFLGKVW